MRSCLAARLLGLLARAPGACDNKGDLGDFVGTLAGAAAGNTPPFSPAAIR